MLKLIIVEHITNRTVRNDRQFIGAFPLQNTECQFRRGLALNFAADQASAEGPMVEGKIIDMIDRHTAASTQLACKPFKFDNSSGGITIICSHEYNTV
ncbi:hypothetical protein D3C75_787550 [compost metagenome]